MELVRGGSTTPMIDLVPPSNVEESPRKHKKMGRLERSPHRSAPQSSPGVGLGSSSLLEESLKIALGVQVALTPAEEEVVISMPVEDMVSVIVETAAATGKLKAELAESTSSLKATLEVVGALEEESRRVKTKLDSMRSQNAALQTEVKDLEQNCTEMTYA